MLDIVIFGGIGDLALRKLLPSLFYLFRDGHLPAKSRILCVSRAKKTRSEFLDFIKGKLILFLGQDFDDAVWSNFSEILYYVDIDLSGKDDWYKLEQHLSSEQLKDRDVIYYLSVTPSLFAPICAELKENNLNSENSRVVVEKPLGEDYESACAINDILANCFSEKQTYRIDHYLGKEAVQNILHLRFSNYLMEAVWNKKHIERIDIKVSETVGVEGRGGFFDRTGTLRDMVQNHLMQLLNYIALEPPKTFGADDIRDQKLKVIRKLVPIDVNNVVSSTIRAQYVAGRIGEHDVPGYLQDLKNQPYDVTGTGETFVALKVFIDNERWQGVPFYLKTGKRLDCRHAEIKITFKKPENDLYHEPDSNQLIIQIQPALTVSINLLMKKLMGTGAALNRHQNQMDLNSGDEPKMRVPEAYERLLREVIKGDQTYFVRGDEILASWEWIDSIRNAWSETNLEMQEYEAGSEGPSLE
jgi:glucose-6-phosphate 1-dehydrogenase